MQLQITEEEKKRIAEGLLRDARYAEKSHNERMVYEVYGKARMARKFHAITILEFKELSELLIHGCVNNADWIREARK